MLQRYGWLIAGVLSLLPAVWLVVKLAGNDLGPDPAEVLLHETGEWSLRLLALTLFVSPLKSYWRLGNITLIRRTLGLFAFTYACIHFLVFLQFYLGWSVAQLLEELAERPYIIAGFSAWLLMLPLALTSSASMQRLLKRNWVRLHRLVYVAAVAACVHLLWQARSDVGEVLVYGALFGLLLAWRLKRHLVSRR